MFTLNSDITIGDFRFKGVNDVLINHSLHSIVSTAVIKVPALAMIMKNDKRPSESVITGKQFKDGDAVTIKLGYNKDLHTEFIGFVKHRDMNMPLAITCEGYSWLLKRNKINISKASVTVKDLLQDAITGIDAKYPITIQCDADIELTNVQVNGCGLDVINKIAEYTDNTVTCFFMKPDVLYCGLLKTPYANGEDALKRGLVQYRLDYNVLKNNTLKQRTADDDKLEVTYSKKLATGTKLTQASDAFASFARTHSRILNQIKNAPALKSLANEKAYSLNYKGYEGSLETFLVPYVAPGYVAELTGNKDEAGNGSYLVESVETHFGTSGARRKVELGTSIGFAKT